MARVICRRAGNRASFGPSHGGLSQRFYSQGLSVLKKSLYEFILSLTFSVIHVRVFLEFRRRRMQFEPYKTGISRYLEFSRGPINREEVDVFRLSWFVLGVFLGCCLAIAAATQAHRNATPSLRSPVAVVADIFQGN